MESALTAVFSDIIQELDSGNVLLSLLNLSAAFDCIDRNTLVMSPAILFSRFACVGPVVILCEMEVTARLYW